MAGIEIKKIIAHDLDLKQDKPSIADKVIDISSTPKEVIDFFAVHVSQALLTKQIKTCKFSRKNGEVLEGCMEVASYLDSNEKFVTITSNMTFKLFNIMKGSPSNSSGTLIFFIYDDDQNSHPFLAIMKMDRNNGIEYDKRKNTFIVHQNMLPSIKERLHKTAFIKLDTDLWNETSHLQVLDKQQSSENGVSKFFMITFLEAEELLNDNLMTTLAHKTLVEFSKREKISSEPINKFEFMTKVEQMFSNGKEIDLDNELDSLLKSYLPGEGEREAKIEEVKTAMKVANPDAYFQFKASKKPSFAVFSNSKSQVSFRFPLSLKDKSIFIVETIENGEKVTIIKIKGTDLEEQIK